MIVLVDYANLAPEDRQARIKSLVETIARQLDPEPLWDDRRLEFRFYGGWYDEHRFTRLAQRLAVELHGDFPYKTLLAGKQGNFPVSLTAELAYSIAARPDKHLFATYRHRGQVKGRVSCRAGHELGCKRPDCPMPTIEAFFRKQACPHSDCTFGVDSFLTRSEQKLVDSMLITDLLHYTRIGHRRIVLVSSDDDFWPGILAVVADGVELVHIYTKDASPASSTYARGLPKHYLSIKL